MKKNDRNSNFVPSRRKTLSKLSWIAMLPLAMIGYQVSENFKKRKKSSMLSVKIANLKDINIFDDAIIINDGKEVRAFSSKCPHLGCKITIVNDNELVCPCHGSRFSCDGLYLSGPANENLKPLKTKTVGEVIHIETDDQ